MWRADSERFVQKDLVDLHRHLSATTKHVFNLEDKNEFGAFLNLVQHHGYPTPLLDWTFSPYVAAFLAYRGISNHREDFQQTDRVRILKFGQEQWREDWEQIGYVAHPILHFTVGQYLAIENERMIPQQAASTVTNVDDIESHITSIEKIFNKKYLWAIDLPISDSDRVIKELRYMGITSSSMFPGLDGACEALKQQNFDI